MRTTAPKPHPYEACTRAFAQRHNIPAMVYSIDDGNERVDHSGPLDYSYGAEFEAFDGRVIAVIWPDGAVEDYR